MDKNKWLDLGNKRSKAILLDLWTSELEPVVDFKEWVTAVALSLYSEIALLTMAMIRLMSQ